MARQAGERVVCVCGERGMAVPHGTSGALAPITETDRQATGRRSA